MMKPIDWDDLVSNFATLRTDSPFRYKVMFALGYVYNNLSTEVYTHLLENRKLINKTILGHLKQVPHAS